MAHGTRYSETELAEMARRFQHGEVELVGKPETVETDETGGTAIMSVRLPRNVIAQLKLLAQERGVGATVLARDFILAGVLAQSESLTGSIPVAEVLRLAAAHGWVVSSVPEETSAERTTKASPSRATAVAAAKRIAETVPVKPPVTKKSGSTRQDSTTTSKRRKGK